MAAEFYNQAPELLNKDKPKSEGNFMQLNMDIFKNINKKVDARHSVARSLLILMVGTADGFRLSQKFALDNLGCSEKRYYEARKYLSELGLITYDKEKNTIKLNYDVLMDRREDSPKEEDRRKDNPMGRREITSSDRREDCYNIEETNNKTKNLGISSDEEIPTAPNIVGLVVKPTGSIDYNNLMQLKEGTYTWLNDECVKSNITNKVLKVYGKRMLS